MRVLQQIPHLNHGLTQYSTFWTLWYVTQHGLFVWSELGQGLGSNRGCVLKRIYYPCRFQSQCRSAEHSHSKALCDGRRAPAESRAPRVAWHTPYSSHSHPGPGWSLLDREGGLQGRHRTRSSPGPLSAIDTQIKITWMKQQQVKGEGLLKHRE